MRTATSTLESEVAILNRLIRPHKPWNAATARAILNLDFDKSDQVRMQELAQKARDGTLTEEEQEIINFYERVGHIIGLLHSKARRSQKKRFAART
jgi:hypothetical protein